jgi:hypothetical protein
VTIADRRQVRRARQAADALRIIRAVSIPGAVLALIGVLLTARRPSSGLLRLAGCLAVSGLLLLGGRLVVRDAIAGQGTAGDVAVAVFDVLARPLRPWVVGGLAAAAALGVAWVPPSDRLMVPSSAAFAPLPACGAPLVVTGGQSRAHSPEHMLALPVSAFQR